MAEAVNNLYDISSTRAHRFIWNDRPGTTIKIEIPQSDAGKVDAEDRWLSVGNVHVQVKKPYGARRAPILQCSNCFRFGHGHLRCPNDSVCSVCSLSTADHECDGVAKCINCKGSHVSTHTRCSRRMQVQEQLIRSNA